jgi:hypothetical protein
MGSHFITKRIRSLISEHMDAVGIFFIGFCFLIPGGLMIRVNTLIGVVFCIVGIICLLAGGSILLEKK